MITKEHHYYLDGKMPSLAPVDGSKLTAMDSTINRIKNIDAAQQKIFDVIIIGGGITGCGIALDAASRGLKVLLLEKNDFGSGTSSKSTKLIHGGLRYLKQFEFGLIRETGRERAILHRLAPHLVVSEKMLLPITETGEYGKLFTSLGLGIYDFLAGVKGADKKNMISVQKAKKKEPLLKMEGLTGAAIYSEYRTDDARLTLANVLTAQRYGAICLSYMQVDDILVDEDRITGVKATDVLTRRRYRFEAEQVVSATGPWVDQMLDILDDKADQKLQLTKGVHVVLPHKKLPVKQSIYFEVGDGRMIFAIPRSRVTYVGTTDTFYNDSLDHVKVGLADAEYLINGVNRAFEHIHISADDIISSWAGLRPLIYEAGKSPSELSRKDEIFINDNGLISIAGGKLTGYRKMAERMVDLIIERAVHLRPTPCITHQIPLHHHPLQSAEDVKSYVKSIRTHLGAMDRPKKEAQRLVHLYGRSTDDVVKRYQQSEIEDVLLRLIIAELDYCIAEEEVYTVADFVIRRSAMLYFKPERLRRYQQEIVEYMGQKLNWSEERTNVESASLENVLSEVNQFI